MVRAVRFLPRFVLRCRRVDRPGDRVRIGLFQALCNTRAPLRLPDAVDHPRRGYGRGPAGPLPNLVASSGLLCAACWNDSRSQAAPRARIGESRLSAIEPHPSFWDYRRNYSQNANRLCLLRIEHLPEYVYAAADLRPHQQCLGSFRSDPRPTEARSVGWHAAERRAERVR